MQADFSQNYFELFGVPEGFEMDSETLALRYRDLQRALHPDRFAGASDRERRLSVQQTARINEAFRTLKDPLARARYLLELRGRSLDDTDTAMDPGFLMEQMELREELGAVEDAADPFAKLGEVRDRIESLERELVQGLANRFAQDTEEALEEARESVRRLQFMRKLLEEADRMEEDLVHSRG